MRHPHRFETRDTGWGMVPITHRRVIDLLERASPTISPETTAAEALCVAEQEATHYLPVVTDRGFPLGVVCRCDLTAAPLGARVAACMSAPAVGIDAEATPEEAASLMLRSGRGCLPVVEDGEVAGLLTRGELLRAGALSEAQVRRCELCGTTSHVAAPPQRVLCRRCRANGPRTNDAEGDLGGGD